MASTPVYDRRTRRLHWIVAGLIAFLWLMAQGNSLLHKGPVRQSIWSIHVLVGFVLVALVAWRIVWWLLRRDRLPPAQRGVWQAVATAVHFLLYLLMITVVVLGVMNVFGHGFPLFNTWRFPKFWEKPFQQQVADWHGLAANVIAGVAVLHAVAALWHHWVLKDGVLHRMWPARASADQ